MVAKGLAVVVLGVSACASPVSVIGPVAVENKRNAEALARNIGTLLAVSEEVLRALVRVSANDGKRDIIRAIRVNETAEGTVADPAQAFQEKARALRAGLAALAPEAREAQKAQLSLMRPLAAEVAFGSLAPRDAARMFAAIDGILRDRNLRNAMAVAFLQAESLQAFRAIDRAAQDVLDAFGTYRRTVLEQIRIGRHIAGQMVRAAEAGAEAGRFLEGVLENRELLGLIAMIVKRSTGDPERARAAEELLQSLLSSSP